MKRFHFVKLLLIILISFLVACSGSGTTEPPIKISENETSNNLIDDLLQQRNQTAFEAYLFALDEAQSWNSAAKLYQIPSTVIISENIGLPAPGIYWFFMFSTENNPREYYIAISNGEVAGTFEAEPLLFEELPYELKTINTSILIDSDEALRLCIETEIITSKEILDNNQLIDYRLIDLGSNPVWSLYLTGSEPFSPLCNIDALTGEVTNDPFMDLFNLE